MNKKDFLRVIVGAVAIMVIASVVFPVREYMRAKADDGIVTDIAEGNDSDLSDNSIEGAETGDSSGLGEDSGAGTETGLDDGAEPGSETGLDGGGEEATEPGGETGLDGGGEEATEPGGETGLDGGSEEGAEPGGETGLDDGEGTEPGGSVPTEPGTDNPVGPIGPKPTDVTPEAGPIEEFFDIAELKSIAREEYDRNYKQKLGSDFSGNIYPMLDYLVETVINGHLYSEGTELELIKKAREDNSYIIQLIGRAFEDEYKKALVIDGAPAEQKSTSPAGSDIVDYRPYRAEDERGSLFPGYIKNITKEVQAEKATVSNEVVDKFREYKVSLGFDISGPPAVSQISGADYVLLIDTSNSMVDNLENAKSAAKKFVDSVFPENYNYDDSNKAEIAVIEFSDSADVAARLTSDREELIDAIDGLRLNRNIDAGKSGTDMQGAILEAKDLLGIDDGGSSVSSSRNKNFIVFSDGVVTTRYTDLWSFDSSLFGQPEIDAEDSDSPNAGVKRWSNLTARDWQDGIVLEKISVAGEDFFAVEEEAGADSEYKKQVELSSLVTILEAQFAVNQGINIYSVDYSDSSEAESLMNGITEKLDDTPDFTTEINSEALGSKGSRSNGNKYYKAVKSADMIDEIISEGSKEIKNPFNGFKITEQLMDNFELVEGSVVISDEPFGEGEVIALGKKSVSKTGINLETTKDYSEGIYYLTYILK
ncbi:MAG: VWA domain-containing protein, partial [Clostridiales bacterium]|nr:VWA domain-containing protein [Clostridiales bacterium]